METKPVKPTFVFFHVGDDVSLPSMLVDSINWTNPGAEIVCCTDSNTPDIPKVTRRVEVAGDRGRLMTYRLDAFSKSRVEGAALYLDTDMLVLRPIDPSSLLGDHEIAMCLRSFGRDNPFNGNFRDLGLTEYDKKPFFEIYPFVACATITRSANLWTELYLSLMAMNPTFHIWYGDQEALKAYAMSRPAAVGFLPEHVFGCLPDQPQYAPLASILHFKGASRKDQMRKFHDYMRSQRV